MFFEKISSIIRYFDFAFNFFENISFLAKIIFLLQLDLVSKKFDTYLFFEYALNF